MDDDEQGGYRVYVPEVSLEEAEKQHASFRAFADSVSYAGNVVPKMAAEADEDGD